MMSLFTDAGEKGLGINSYRYNAIPLHTQLPVGLHLLVVDSLLVRLPFGGRSIIYV